MEKEEVYQENKKKNTLWINMLLMVLFIGVMIYVCIKYGRQLIKLSKDAQLLRETILSYGGLSVAALMVAQVIQVVIAFIPGEIVQMMGGYIFGPIWGTIYSLIGITAGAAIVFFIVRITGYPLVRVFVSEKHLKKFDFLMKSKKGETAMFILFLIPGIPKDILVYISGLTPIKPARFFTLFMIARIPALAASCWFGSSIYEQNYIKAIIISVVMVILVVIGFLKREKLLRVIGKRTAKDSHRQA